MIGYVLLLLMCWSCQPAEKGFTVKGRIEGYTGTKLFVREITPHNKVWMNDTLEVKDGQFIYQGKVESPRLVYFVPENFTGRYELFLENAEIEWVATDGSFRDVKVTGSPSHDEYLAVKRKSGELINSYSQYEGRKQEAAKQDSLLYRQLADSTAIWAGRLLSFLKQQENYPQSKVLPYFANEWIKSEDIQGMEDYLGGLTPEARKSVYAQYCDRVLQQEKRVLPGNVAYDFTLQDTSGKAYRLSDYRGKYVLLEFSASWCGWCKLEIPYLKKVFDLSRDKNLVMFTVNMDKERKLWVDDVAKDNLPWTVLSDLTAFEGEMARQYNIRGIPVIFLINPEGRIVTNQLRGDGMIRYMDQLLNPETPTN